MPVLLTGARVLAESEVGVERADRFAGFKILDIVRDRAEQRDVLQFDGLALRASSQSS